MIFNNTKHIVLEAKKAADNAPKMSSTDYTKASNAKATKTTDTKADAGIGADKGTTKDATDYTAEEKDVEPTDYTDKGDDDVSDTDDGDTDDPTDNSEDSGDDPTDYTDSGDDDSGDDGSDDNDDTDDDSSEDDDSEETDKVSESIKNYSLIQDFIELYRLVDENIERISELMKSDMTVSIIVNQIIKNLSTLKTSLYNYIYISFDNRKYIENLYQYNCFIEALKINIQMIQKIKDLDIR